VIDAGRGVGLQQRSGGRGDVPDIRGRHRAVGEHGHFDSRFDPADDAVETASRDAAGSRAPEQALHAQHESARDLEGKPLAEQFRRRVDALGIGPVVFGRVDVPSNTKSEL
jgi:hypothetical protein